ncbi:MAG: B12-binding domain-containing radical SAM protein [Thermoleophilia bacterium]
MKVLLVNPPYKSQIVRRYVCSYNAPNFLFPPLELMYLSAQAKLVPGCEVMLLDCVAEGLSSQDAISRAIKFKPDLVVAIMAIEFFDNDVLFLTRLKRELPLALVGCFGHLPSNFSRDTLDATKCDFILMGEPDLAFRALLQRRVSDGGLPGEGLSFIADGGEFVQGEYQRLDNLDDLPFADQAAVDSSRYGEPFFGHPYTTFQSSRGCPFPCAYCVRSYGRKLVMASADHVVAEVESAVRNQGIKYFRFMDDTFTVSRRRVLEICEGLKAKGLDISWSCLTRPNTIDGEIARALKEAGCKRVYVGIESGSQKVLDYLQRGYQLDAAMDNLREVRDSGLEMVGWFIVGSPAEEREDFEMSLALARELRLQYVAVSTLVPYPSTELFEREREDIKFSLQPYQCEFNDQADTGREAEFYRRYYLTPTFIMGKLGTMASHPVEVVRSTGEFLRYVLASRRDPNRRDML